MNFYLCLVENLISHEKKDCEQMVAVTTEQRYPSTEERTDVYYKQLLQQIPKGFC